MKIKIQDGNFKMTLVFPTCLLYSRLTGKILAVILKKLSPNVPLGEKEIRKLQRVIKQIKRKHHRLELVSVESKEDRVKIFL